MEALVNAEQSALLKIYGKIDNSCVTKFLNDLQSAKKRYAIEINSTGGNLKSLYEIQFKINEVAKSNGPILFLSVAKQKALSAGLFALQIAPLRTAYKNTKFLLHRAKNENGISMEASGLETEEYFFELLAQKAKQPVSLLYKIAGEAQILDAEQALRLNFIDLIL